MDSDVLVVALSVVVARLVLRDATRESLWRPWVWAHAATLGGLAFVSAQQSTPLWWCENLAVVAGAEVASYLVGRGVHAMPSLAFGCATWAAVAFGQGLAALRLAISAWVFRAIPKRELGGAVAVAVFASLPKLAAQLLPVTEFQDAYGTLERLHDEETRAELWRRTLFVAVIGLHVQLTVGWTGVAYLRASQFRKNALVDGVANGKLTARQFATRKTVSFVARFAVPYIIQRVSMEAVYEVTFKTYTFRVSRALRVEAVLGRTSSALGALSESYDGRLTLEAYGAAAEATARRIYELTSRKIFSVPKMALLPSLLASNPAAFAYVPLFVVVDGLKARAVASLTTAIEEEQNKLNVATSKRGRVEAHDTQKAFAIEAIGASRWNDKQWRGLTHDMERHAYLQTALATVRRYVRWLYWSDVLTPAVEVVLARMLEADMIIASDLWVMARAFEDTLDTLLTRSRAEAELASLRTDVQRLNHLCDRLDSFRSASVANLTCAVGDEVDRVEITNLNYERGTARAAVPSFTARPGEVIAVTGPNSSGKSTLLALLRTCNGLSPPVGASVLDRAAVTLPRNVAHITQKPYCPLHARPIDWLFFPDEPRERLSVAAELLVSLDFDQNTDANYSSLLLQHDDYCGALSGGQAVKFEIARQILLPRLLGRPCPALILLDESLAPLDPAAKRNVQRQLRHTCPDAITLVVYHADAQAHSAGQPSSECVPAADFFTDVAHFSKLPPPQDDDHAALDRYSRVGGLVLTRVGTCEAQQQQRESPSERSASPR